MNVKLEVDCTPEEARTFLGLPDVRALNTHLVEGMKARMDAGAASMAPEELMKNWMNLGGQASEHFRKLITVAAASAATARPAAKPPE